jgi:serine/threonine protein phosphatase 1
MRYAISDIHGCYQTFQYLVAEVLNLQPTDELYLLGDYIDRGPDSKGVIDFIVDLQEAGFKVRTLSGNHEVMMLQALDNPQFLAHWHLNGGQATLDSFGAETVFDIPLKYWQFLQQLPFYFELEDYLLVHAGFNFKAEDPFSDMHAMVWIRNFKINQKILGHRKIVHGHTPTPATFIAKQVADPAAKVYNIDGGCVYHQVPKLGHLTALNLDSLDLHKVPYRG